MLVAAFGAAGLAEASRLSVGGSGRTATTTAGSPSPGRRYYGGPFADSFSGSVGLAVGATVLLGGAWPWGPRCCSPAGAYGASVGVTGDVYGACVELAFTAMLVVPALLLP